MIRTSRYNSFIVEKEINGRYLSTAGTDKFLPISAALIAFLSGFNGEHLNIPHLKPQRPIPHSFSGPKELSGLFSLPSVEKHVFWYTVDELTLYDYSTLERTLPGQWFELIEIFRQVYTPSTRVYFIIGVTN